MRAFATFASVMALLTTAAAARAEGLRAVAPPGGGLDALEVRLDASAGVVRWRVCRAADCSDTGGAAREVPIAMERSRLDLSTAKVDVIAIGDGKRVVHVRVSDIQRKDLAFEAILAARGDEPIFAGLTGYTRGDEGDRAGDVVLVYDRDDKSKFVLVAEAREDTRICGQATTPLGARGLDAHSLELRGATLHRIDKKVRDGAERVVASPRAPDAKAPLARVLVATGGSAPKAALLTDGDPATTWSEQRPGDGHGEFATMRAPSELSLASIVVTVAPPAPAPGSAAASTDDRRAAPRTFFLATDTKLFHVTMPEDAWQKPGVTYEVPLPGGVRTTCVAIVLDEAYAAGRTAPEVSIAEMNAWTSFDAEGASLDAVTQALSGPRADEAAALLKRSGKDGLEAVAKRFGALTDGGARALAVDIAASAGACDGAAGELLTRALADRETEVKRRALGRLERCGKSASDALVSAVRSSDEMRRAAAAPLLATVAPSVAIEPLAEQMGRGGPPARRAIRGAFARVAASSTRDKLLGLLARVDASPVARLDLLRALGPKLAELRPESDQAVAEILRTSPDMPTRYLLAQPLAHLARSPDATPGELSRLADLARRDPEWPVRAHAVELAAGIGPLAPTVAAAASDPEPRVREAAQKAIAQAGTATGAAAAAHALAHDEWTFVRVAAAEALGAIPPDSASAQALADALADPSTRVRWAAVAALGRLRATAHAARLRERLDDTNEDTEVRALAAKTLGAMCVQNATDRLTKLALLARAPADEADDRVGRAAIEALGVLHPVDLDKRLAPLRDKGVRPPVRRAAEEALADPGACR